MSRMSEIDWTIRETLAETDLSVAEIAEGLGVPVRWVTEIAADVEAEEQEYV